MSDFFVFAESFIPNPQVARNTFDFSPLCCLVSCWSGFTQETKLESTLAHFSHVQKYNYGHYST